MDFDFDTDAITDVEQFKELVKRLRLHEIELEMQNWELLKASNIIEENRDYYLDFYENAPTGIVIMNEKGLVASVNSTFSKMLNLEKVDIEKTNIYSLFKNSSESDKLHISTRKLLETKEPQVFELSLETNESITHNYLVTANLKRNNLSDENEIFLYLCKVPGHLQK